MSQSKTGQSRKSKSSGMGLLDKKSVKPDEPEIAEVEVMEDDPEPVEENYFKVIFHAKSNVNDLDNVELSVNGESLVIMRDTEVVLPERFLECADNTTFPVFKQLPGKSRKTIGKVQTYPYTKIAPATREEFISMKNSGTKITRENLEKYGMGGDEQ